MDLSVALSRSTSLCSNEIFHSIIVKREKLPRIEISTAIRQHAGGSRPMCRKEMIELKREERTPTTTNN